MMNQKEVISLLDEVIRVLEEGRGNRKQLLLAWSVCFGRKKQAELLGELQDSFSSIIRLVSMRIALFRAMPKKLNASSEQERRRLGLFFRRVRQNLSMSELLSVEEECRLASRGLEELKISL